MGCTVGILTKKDLTRALQSKLGMAAEEAEAQAEYLLDIFGFDTRVIDNVLEPEDRQFFYALQEEGLLTVRSEETPLWNGQEWRTHYWILREEKVWDAAEAAAPAAKLPPEADVYLDLPEECWARA